MVDFKVDLGQIVIVTFIAIIGWFFRKVITDTNTRIDRIEENVNDQFQAVSKKFDDQNKVMFDLAGNVQKIIGMFQFNFKGRQG